VDATTCELADLSGSLYTLVAHFLVPLYSFRNPTYPTFAAEVC